MKSTSQSNIVNVTQSMDLKGLVAAVAPMPEILKTYLKLSGNTNLNFTKLV